MIALAEASAEFDKLSADIDVALASTCRIRLLDANAFSFVSIPRKLNLLLGYLQRSNNTKLSLISDLEFIEHIQHQYQALEHERNAFVKRKGKELTNECAEPKISASEIVLLRAKLSGLLDKLDVDMP